jgi:hypothetical protein
MFCPACGRSDQAPDTFCRGCGTYLPDFESIKKKEVPVSEHLNANGVLSVMTIVASFALAFTLYAVFFHLPDTHPVIYITTGFLIAIGCWNIQTAYRTILLKRRLNGAQEAAKHAINVMPEKADTTRQLSQPTPFEEENAPFRGKKTNELTLR